MRLYKKWIVIAGIMYVLAWFLPVVVGGYRGWAAFRVALSPIWPYEDFTADSALAVILSVASGLSNILFIVVAGLLWRWPKRVARISMWSLIIAALVNAYWFTSLGRGDLRAGYYLWLVAFLVLAFSAYRASSQASADGALGGSV